MATSGRPKRTAAIKKAKIIISDTSDSEDDKEHVKPNKINNNLVNLDDSYSPNAASKKQKYMFFLVKNTITLTFSNYFEQKTATKFTR